MKYRRFHLKNWKLSLRHLQAIIYLRSNYCLRFMLPLKLYNFCL